MLKFRSMRLGAAQTGVNSTAAGDTRITQSWPISACPETRRIAAIVERSRRRNEPGGPAAAGSGGRCTLYRRRAAHAGSAAGYHGSGVHCVFRRRRRFWPGARTRTCSITKSSAPGKAVSHCCISNGAAGRAICKFYCGLGARWSRGSGRSRGYGNFSTDGAWANRFYDIVRRDSPLPAFPPPGARDVVAKYRMETA